MLHLKLNKTWIGVIAAALPMLAGCGQLSNYRTRTAVLSSISDAEWAAAAANPVTISFVNSSTKFSPENTIFQVGKPYVLKVVNPAISGNLSSGAEHYLADYYTNSGVDREITGVTLGGGTRWSSNGFWSSIVINKIVTRQAEYRVPFMLDFEINKTANNGGYGSGGATGNISASAAAHGTNFALIQFVPVRSGSYKVWCSKSRSADGIGGHQAMTGNIQIVGSPDGQPDFELESDFDDALAKTGHRDGSHAVWTSQRGGTLDVAGSGAVSMVSTMYLNAGTDASEPKTMKTSYGKGYQLRFRKGSGASDSYRLESDLFRNVAFRKIQDIDVQLKPIYVESVTLLGGVGDSSCLPLSATTDDNGSNGGKNCKADADISGASTAGYNGSGNPGKRQVDFWIVPQASKSGSYNMTFTNVSTGTALTEVMSVE